MHYELHSGETSQFLWLSFLGWLNTGYRDRGMRVDDAYNRESNHCVSYFHDVVGVKEQQ